MKANAGTSEKFHGVFTAVVTPFQADGTIDWKAYENLVEAQLDAGLQGLVPCGTTGESPTLTDDERAGLIERTVKLCRGRALVIAGTGSNDTRKSIVNSKEAMRLGADAILVVTPYYNKPSATGLEHHYKAIASSCDIPMILYNVPGRTGISLTPETVAELAKHPRIIGIKEASGNLSLLTDIRAAVHARASKSFVYLTGDDPTFWPFMMAGGHGVISVASNALPNCMRAIYESAISDNPSSGLALYESLHGFFRDLFLEANPAGVKTVLSWMGRMQLNLRLPLVPMQSNNEKTLRESWGNLPKALQQDHPPKESRA